MAVVTKVSSVAISAGDYLHSREGHPSIQLASIALEDIPCNPAVMLASLHVVFPIQLASYWRAQDLDVVIITEEPSLSGRLPDGTFVLSLSDYESASARALRQIIGRVLRKGENIFLAIGRRVRPSRANVRSDYVLSRVVISLMLNLSYARLARKLRPRFVFGHQVYRTGFALSRLKQFMTALMPYGQDIYLFPKTGRLAWRYIWWCVRRVRLVCPASTAAGKHLVREFGVDACRVFPVSWGVDSSVFCPASSDETKKFRERYGIASGKVVITNVRRFAPEWGSDTVLKAFSQLAKLAPSCHFILFSGNRQSLALQAAQVAICEMDLAHSFTFLESSVSLQEFAEILSITRIFTSLMVDPDMRSSSLLQAAASGGLPVLSDQPEYREMEKSGFRGLFVDHHSPDEVVDAVVKYLNDPNLCAMTSKANTEYMLAHEDYGRQMSSLLGRILQDSK